jgi:hypothetical protein
MRKIVFGDNLEVLTAPLAKLERLERNLSRGTSLRRTSMWSSLQTATRTGTSLELGRR